MLAKLTSKNQLTIPVELLRALPRSEYFDASVEKGRLVLKPVSVVPAIDLETVRNAIAAAGIGEDEVAQAVKWARKTH